MSRQNDIEVVKLEVETSDSDDSQGDPSFDILEETQSKFSNLSIKKKPRYRVPVEVDEDIDFTEPSAPEFDANDEKSFEIVQKMIEGCQVEKLKVEQCKLYLRKHGLRLTGKKDILIQRIKEHISIKNGEGEHKYPASSFVMNCKGDACTGDVVMFEQNVYEMFNIASRSASGPSCGKRVVVGRIVKESYGAAKQQHTFTIEVLWSKGVKPLPPLHPLLIKGRNLYRLKTMRQIWEDESQRQKILSEKHARGNAARTEREACLHEKETRKALRENRDSKGNKKQEIRKTSPIRSILNSRTSIQLEAINSPDALSNTDAGAPFIRGALGELPSKSMSYGALHNENITPNTCRGLGDRLSKSMSHGALHNENITPNSCSSRPSKSMFYNRHVSRGMVDGPYNKSFQDEQNLGWLYPYPSNFYYPPHRHRHSYSFQRANHHYQGQRQQLCRYYAQGRCHYGTNCKYLH